MFNLLSPEQNEHRFANDIFICIFLKELFSNKIHWSLFPGIQFMGYCDSTYVRIMAWCRTGLAIP